MSTTAQSSSKAKSPRFANPAVARCAKAWERAYNKIISVPDRDKAPEDREDFARDEAEIAFRKALPPLCGEENIRDFIACVAYALINEILLPIVCTNYLDAAKIALTAVRVHRRPQSGAA